MVGDYIVEGDKAIKVMDVPVDVVEHVELHVLWVLLSGEVPKT